MSKKTISIKLLLLLILILILTACTSQQPSSSQSKFELTGVANARDLGGYTTVDGRVVKDNLLLRTGLLTNLTDEDKQALLNEYNLKWIIDFRTPNEIAANPEPVFDGVQYINLNLTGGEDTWEPAEGLEEQYTDINIIMVLTFGDAGAAMRNSYVDFVIDEHSQAIFAEFFNILLNNEDGAILWHCTWGKDRTGTAAALLLSALGVDRETIMQDYLLTNEYITNKIETSVNNAQKETDNKDILDEVRLLAGVDKSFLDTFFETIDTEYGSVQGYLEEIIGLTEDDFALLKDKYTE